MQHRVLFFQSTFWSTQIVKLDKVYLINSYTIHSDIFCLTFRVLCRSIPKGAMHYTPCCGVVLSLFLFSNSSLINFSKSSCFIFSVFEIIDNGEPYIL